MKAFLVDISAFQIWFCDQGVIRTSNPLELVKDYRFATSSRAELPLDQIGRLGLRGQIHVAVPNHVRRHHQAGITAHVISSPTPYSFVRLSKDVYVESPEATLVRMASHLNRGELAVMINQLLSCYRICKGAIVKARPLSTKTQLLEQLDRFKGKRGAKKARRALTYAVAETASPAEAKVAALLTLPARWGGKGLPLPEANAEIVLTAPGTHAVPGTHATTMVANTCPAQKHTTKENGNQIKRYADYLWKAWKLILEYESDAFHASSEKLGADSARRAELQREGYTVVTLTNRQLSNTEEFSIVVDTLLKKMGRPDKTAQVENYDTTESELRRQVFSYDPLLVGIG